MEISKTADKALVILSELSELGTATPQRLASRTGINKSVVQRLLATLFARGFVTRLNGEYSLAHRLRSLARGVQPRLRPIAERCTGELSTSITETVVFQILDGTRVVVLAESPRSEAGQLHVRHEVGAHSLVTQTASGLAVLAALPSSEAMRLLRAVSEGDDHEARVSQKLREIAQTGLARTSDELQEGVSGMAVAVRWNGEVVGSLAVLVPSERTTDLDAYVVALRDAVESVERALGESPLDGREAQLGQDPSITSAR